MNGKVVIVFALMISLSSCSRFLEVEPDTQISIKEQFSTKEGVFQAVNGMYYDFESLYTGKLIVYGDLLGGNITFSPAENDQILEIPPGKSIERIYEFDDLASESQMEAVYSKAYALINAANLILKYVADNGVLDADEIQQITAEALACRAYTHYIVAQLYAQNYSFTADASHLGIVYNKTTITAGVDLL